MSTNASVALAKEVSRTLQNGDRVGFRKAVTSLMAMNVPLGKGWHSLTQPLLGYGELSLACSAIDRYVAEDGSVQARFDQANVYARCGRSSDAVKLVERLGASVPDRASNAFLRGTLAMDMGDLAAAREHLLAALATRPQSGQVAQSLASLGPLSQDNEVAERLLAAAQTLDAAGKLDRAMFGYALGKLHADRGDPGRAFEAYARGAALVAAGRWYDEAADRAGAEAALAGWDGRAIRQVSDKVNIATDRPIIVTGMPRSGTTLAEQILASHSAVVGGGELGVFRHVVNDMGGSSAAAALRLIERSDPNRVTAEYLRLTAEQFAPPGRVVDKTLEASRYLATLAALLPDAPIVWMRRKPLAHAWSCFSTFFLAGLPWTYDQAAIARHFRIEEMLEERWQAILGDRLLFVDYETLVRDKETVVPKMLAHCGLPMEAATLTPEQTERLVRTASVAQVRSPVGTARVDAAETFRGSMAPFLETYHRLGGDA